MVRLLLLLLSLLGLVLMSDLLMRHEHIRVCWLVWMMLVIVVVDRVLLHLCLVRFGQHGFLVVRLTIDLSIQCALRFVSVIVENIRESRGLRRLRVLAQVQRVNFVQTVL